LYFSETSSNINYLQGQLPAESVVLNIEPDTLFFDLGVKRSKIVPVVADVDFSFKSGFNFVGTYQISPKEVTISGPEKVIDSINEVHTVDFEMNDISEPFEQKVQLKDVGKSVVLSEESILIKGNVDKITHGSYQIPFKVINLPRNVIISTYPKQVKVMFQVPLSDYSKIPENGFRIQCDFKRTQDNNLDYLIPVLVDKPEIITDVKIIPNKIEFLIKK
jgi:YbbR domain-containing protein